MSMSKTADIVRITPEEMKRREAYLLEGLLPYDRTNPYSWSMPARMALASGIGLTTWWSLYNVWYRRPWYASFFPKAILSAGAVTATYFIGKARSYNFASRDAVIDHYMQLHPEDFERTADYNGRAYREILLPWYPVRPHYRKGAPDEFEMST